MIRAVRADDTRRGDGALSRLQAIKEAVGSDQSDTAEFAHIAQLTGLSNSKSDSLHRLIMDMHRALNRLSAAHAEEVLAGAHVYGLLPQDRSAVTAFMCGVERTRRLKFDHPGLATTATRSGSRLTIQNDIGETDAHVVVIAVEAGTVTVTYTDVHLARAKFFTGLLRDFPVQWSGLDRKSAEGLGDDGVFYLVTGVYRAGNDKERDGFLEAVGASLVFLIDWNKARKVLRVGFERRLHPNPRLGGAPSFRSPCLSRIGRQRPGCRRRASRYPDPHRLWRAARSCARPPSGG